MKNGNWIGFVWAASGFALLGIGWGEWYGYLGAVVLASWLIFVFWSYLKK